ncbi:MAG: HEAT repeat domain-containing protein [Planctomycetes bacterium]|nr:HEAT repeat domain-containing protein [Planctomycetota bacterium]
MALFKRGDDLPTLLRRVDARDWKDVAEKKVILDALAACGDLRGEDYVRMLLSADGDVARFAIEGVAKAKTPRLADDLLEALHRTPSARWRPIVMALHRLPGDVLAARLDRMIDAKRTEHRAAAVEVIAGHPTPRHMAHLLRRALKDAEEAIRVRAVHVLGQDGRAPEIRPLLTELIASEDEPMRHAAIEALARDPDPSLIEPFFELLPNQPPRLQDLMLRGLRRMLGQTTGHLDRVLECILPILSAEDKKLREAAAALLTAMPDKLLVLRRFLQYAKGLAFWLRDRAFGAIASVADDIVEAILALLDDEDPDVVVGAVFMAGESRDARLFEGLKLLLARDWDWWVKLPAMELLARFAERGVTPVLLDKLADEDLRTAALAALGRRAEHGTLPHVLPFLAHERRGLRRTALAALEGYKDPAVIPPLVEFIRRDRDGECRIVALEILDGLGAEGVAAAAALREEAKAIAPDAGPVTLELVRREIE